MEKVTIVSAQARKPGRLGVLLATGLLATLLAACGSMETEQSGEAGLPSTIVAGEPFSPEYIAIVDLSEGHNLDALAARLNGTVVVDSASPLGTASSNPGPAIGFIAFNESHPEYDGLIIEENRDRFSTSAALVPSGDNELVYANGNSKVWAEGNSKVWAEGNSKVWAEGNSKVWAEGNSKVWAEGEFQWMPENTHSWRQVRLEEGHDEASLLGLGVVVAIIDTGIDTTHPAFWTSAEQNSLSAAGWDFVDNDNDPSEEGSPADPAYGHGTIVAGIVRQIAPRATILPIRALEADGSGDLLNVVRAVYYAVAQGADVINLSLGGGSESEALTAAIAYADSQGVFVTSTAGNNNADRLNYPGAIAPNYDFVISVTSLDSENNKSEFSNYGAAAELAAPGERIHGPYPGERLAAWSGTSMAAPVVAGALALALGEPELDESLSMLAGEMFRESTNIYNPRQNRRYYTRGSNGERLLGWGLLNIGEFLDEVVD